ncbi:hypothetical protein FKM82_026052 [Ascaphus truei]
MPPRHGLNVLWIRPSLQGHIVCLLPVRTHVCCSAGPVPHMKGQRLCSSHTQSVKCAQNRNPWEVRVFPVQSADTIRNLWGNPASRILERSPFARSRPLYDLRTGKPRRQRAGSYTLQSGNARHYPVCNTATAEHYPRTLSQAGRG